MTTNDHEYFPLSPEICECCGPLRSVLGALIDSIYGNQEHGGKSISSKEVLSDIQDATNQNGDRINFYPSDSKGSCCDQLMVLALNGWPAAYGTHGNLNCGQALEILVQHVQGCCHNMTRWAVLVTANWDNFAYDKWQNNIEVMRKQGVKIVFLQLGPKGLSIISA